MVFVFRVHYEKKELLAVCGIFLILVSTSMVSGTTSVANAQSTEGVSGQGNLSSPLACGASNLARAALSFSATGSGGSINSDQFSIAFFLQSWANGMYSKKDSLMQQPNPLGQLR
jgi:hypothetical protein